MKELEDWSQARFAAESAAIDRAFDAGRSAEAVQLAQGLVSRATAAGESAYPGAPYDLAMASFDLGRALNSSGAPRAALPPLREARDRFERLAAAGNEDAKRMASACLTESADCLRDLGQLDEAEAAYEEAIGLDEARQDRRDVAAGKNQLGTVRMLQGRHGEALAAHHEALQFFEERGEPRTVAVVWHQIGVVHQEAGRVEAAEHAYRRSLALKVAQGNRSGEASTLVQLGNLYNMMGRTEEALRFYLDAAAIAFELGESRIEAIRRSNAADKLLKLGRYAEARPEIERAIECGTHFGHTTRPWQTFDMLHRLEGALGNTEAASRARQQAIDAFFACRQDGGQCHTTAARLVADVEQAIAAAKVAEMGATLERIAGQPGMPHQIRPFFSALHKILAGSRDPALAADPELHYKAAGELLLLLKRLPLS